MGRSNNGESGQSAEDRGVGWMKRALADRVFIRKSWIPKATCVLMSVCVRIGSLYALCATVDKQNTDGRSCMSAMEYRDIGGRPESCESVDVNECSLSIKRPTRGDVREGLRVRRVLMAENVDGGGTELGSSSECTNSLWSEGDIRECSVACTSACRAWEEHGE